MEQSRPPPLQAAPSLSLSVAKLELRLPMTKPKSTQLPSKSTPKYIKSPLLNQSFGSKPETKLTGMQDLCRNIKSYIENNNIMDTRQHKHLRAVKGIMTKLTKTCKSLPEEAHDYTGMIANKNTLLYCHRKKEDFERRIVTSSLAVQKLDEDLNKLEPLVSRLIYTSYEEAKEEMEKMEDLREKDILITSTWNDKKESEFCEKMKSLKEEADILKKWEYKTNLVKSLKEEIEEDQLFLQDTEDVITRLKIRAHYL